MTPQEFAATLDATNLKLDASDGEICALCDEVAHSGFASVCVYTTNVSICSDILYSSQARVCTVIGFPHGRSSLEAKREEIVRAQEHGANEVDIVMNYAALRASDKTIVTEEIVRLCEVARKSDLLTKIIVENITPPFIHHCATIKPVCRMVKTPINRQPNEGPKGLDS